MIFLGMSFFGDANATKTYPVDVNQINYIELMNALYDDFYVTKDIDSYNIEYEWNDNTFLHATFDNNTVAGNMNWYLDNTKEILLKRKGSDNNKWITIYDRTIEDIDDFNIVYNDYIANSNIEYKYAVVPVSHDNVEGSYVYATNKDDGNESIHLDFRGVSIIGKDKQYSAYMELGDTNTTRNQKVGVLDMMYNTKPKIFINSDVNYDSGSTSGFFIPMNDDCSLDIKNSYTYQKEIIDFLTDKEPKLLKLWDGRSWIIEIVGNPTVSSSDFHDIRIIEFEWVEVGNPGIEKDLYKSGLINTPEEFWSNYYL